jgi:hypothetical protein
LGILFKSFRVLLKQFDVLLKLRLAASAAVYEFNAFFVLDLIQPFEKLADMLLLDLTAPYLS